MRNVSTWRAWTGLAGIMLAVAFIWLACADSSREVTAEGKSTTTVTATRHIRFKATGPMSFPESMPGIGGTTLPAGQTIDIELDPGESVTFKDKVTITGETVIIGPAEMEQTQHDHGDQERQTDSRSSSAPVADPEPLVGIRFAGTVNPGSTYTWTVPSLFGDTEAVVAVTGQVSATAGAGALVDDGAGGWILDPGQLVAFDYQVTGPPAVWQAPIETPYGTIEGSGTIETDGGMVYGFAGGLDAISGSGISGYVDDDGRVFEYGYFGAFPVRLTIADGVAVGMTTVEGGFDTF